MERTEGLRERVWDGLRAAFCAMHGHDSLLQYESDRLCLKCVSCGHESPGWTLDETAPIARARGDARGDALPDLIEDRRVA